MLIPNFLVQLSRFLLQRLPVDNFVHSIEHGCELVLKADEFVRERDIELAGEGTFEWEAGGVGSWGTSVGVGYESTDDLRDDFSEGIKVLADSGDGGALGPNNGMAVRMLLVLGFGCAKGPEEGAGRV